MWPIPYIPFWLQLALLWLNTTPSGKDGTRNGFMQTYFDSNSIWKCARLNNGYRNSCIGCKKLYLIKYRNFFLFLLRHNWIRDINIIYRPKIGTTNQQYIKLSSQSSLVRSELNLIILGSFQLYTRGGKSKEKIPHTGDINSLDRCR